MASSNLADLLSCIPGDYVFSRKGYDRPEGFRDDMNWMQWFCQQHGFVFHAILEPKSNQPEAFFVHV